MVDCHIIPFLSSIAEAQLSFGNVDSQELGPPMPCTIVPQLVRRTSCASPSCTFRMPCTPEHIAKEQGSFLAAIQTSHTAALDSFDDYSSDAPSDHLTALSATGWAGCAAPLVCVDCAGIAPEPVDTQSTVTVSEGALDQTYLAVVASDSATFRCLDGTCMRHCRPALVLSWP